MPSPPKINIQAPSQNAMMSLLNDHQHNLAIEMAAELETPKEILKRYSLTKKDFMVLAATPKFKEQFKAAKIAWLSPMNAKERVSMKAAMISEGGLLKLHQLIHDTDTPPSNVVATHQHVSTLGALMPSKAGGDHDTGTKHSITINLHNPDHEKEVKVISAAGQVIDHAGDAHDDGS